MAKTGYQAVALDPAVAKSLRGVAHYMSVISGQRVTMSDAVHQLVTTWAQALELPDYVVQAIHGQQPVPLRPHSDHAQP